MEYEKIENDFIVRTLKLINDYKGKYDTTLLINCCLGLLILPKEKHYKSIPNKKIPLNKKLWGLSRKSITVDCPNCGYKLSDVIRRIRNGICHFKVRTLPDGSGEINKLEIKDRGQFKVVFTVKELKQFTKSFANYITKPKQV